MTRLERFEVKLKSIHQELPPGAHLLIVSKTRSSDEIEDYYRLGHRDFGENKVQELLTKAHDLKDRCPEIRWHMIGHLQSNKLNQLFEVPLLHAVHSVHSRELLDKMIKHQERLTHPIKVFLQFNTSHETEKSGFETYTELLAAAELIKGNHKLKLAGLMTMGTLRTHNFEAEAGRCFQELQVEKEKLSAELNLHLLASMGMSQDYVIALKEGSNWIRLGTMMFA